MKIEVAKSDLEVALKVVSTTVGSGSDLSAHYLFRIHEDQTEVLSSYMRVFSRSSFTSNTDGEDGDAFTVEAWRLDKWISSVGDGVLTLASDENGEVIAKGPRSRIKLRSLDASRFPFWDGLLSNAESMGEIDPGVLHRAISLSKNFVSTDDTQRPNICQIEANEGNLMATNRQVLSSVKVCDLSNLSLRIPTLDIGTVLKFLGDKTTQESAVDVLEASRPDGGGEAALVVMRPDGSYIGVSRPTLAMPRLPVEVESTDITLTLDVSEFRGAIDVLLASAPKGHEIVRFSSVDGALVLSMSSDAGGEDEYPLITSTATGLGDVAFSLTHSYIGAISDHFDLDTLSLGVHQRGQGGYVSFVHQDEGATEDSGNHYHTVIVWRA